MAVELLKVPEEIKSQLGSEQTTALLMSINDGLYVSDSRAIPHLIFLLETKGLATHDFIQSIIRDAKVTEEEAKSIAKEIKEKIFEPMRYALFQWGVDISDIKVNDAVPLKNIEPLPTAGIENKKTISLENIGSEKGSESIPIIKEEPVKIDSSVPFILHEEKKQETAGEKKSVLKSFSIPLGFFKPKNPSASALSAKPVRVGVEAPDKDEKKVINYSELRTLLSPFDTGSNFISIGDAPKEMAPAPTQIPTPTIPATPAPEKKPEAPIKIDIIGTIKKPEPKIEGNTIDLR